MEERLDIVVDSSSAKRGIDVLINAMGQLATSAKNSESSVEKLFSTMNKGLNNLQSAVLSLKSVILAFGSVITVFKSLSEQITKFQAFISAMSVSVGGIKEARTEFTFLMGMADKLGISITALSHNYSQLSAAAVATGTKQEDLRKIFENFSIAARVMHLSTIDTRLMFYALTQMVSKGVVSMEELRRQLGEKLPGAMNIAARSVNTDMQTFEAAVRKGMVNSTKFLAIFSEEVKRSFSPGLAVASTALDAEINRMNNSIQRFIIALYDAGVADSFTKIIKELNRILSDKSVAEEFASAIKKISDEVTNFLQKITPENIRTFVTNFSSAITALGQAITRDVLPFIKELASIMGDIVTAWAIIKGIQLGAGAGRLAGPWGAAAGGVAGGVGAYAGVQNIKGRLARARGPGFTGGTSGEWEPNPQPWDMPPDTFLPTRSPYKLSDVLQPPKKKEGGASAFLSFIETLKERDIATQEDSNQYDALREKAKFLAKKEPDKAGKLKEAFEYIDRLESKGIEFKPLIDRLSGLISHIDKNVPDEIDRLVDNMIVKYPMATEAASKARELAATFRKEYFAKKEKEQSLFLEKQNEIIRRMEVEGQLYEEQIELLSLTNDQRDLAIKKLDMTKRLEEQIVQLRNEALKNNRTFDEISFRQRGQAQIESTVDSLRRLQVAGRSSYDGLKKAVADYADNATNDFKNVQEVFGLAMRGMEDALTAMVTKGKFDFKSLGQVVFEEITRMIIKINLAKAALDFSGQSGGFGGGFGSILGSIGRMFGANVPLVSEMVPGQFSLINPAYGAKGLVIEHGNVIPFAKGGIINSPTLFPMKNGYALGGEAGTEAIMPLARGRDGKLGVKGGGGTVIYMTVNTPDANSFSASKDQIVGELASAISRRGRRMN